MFNLHAFTIPSSFRLGFKFHFAIDIVTLDPNRFDETKQKRLDIGHLRSFTPFITLRNQSSPVLARQSIQYEYLSYTVRKNRKMGNPIFPPVPELFYITLRRQKNLALQENYASELHQVINLNLSRAGLTRTSWD
jgi:hypothetical protein